MRRRRGFILATTLMVMTLLTVMLAAAFALISAESRTTDGSYSNTRSLNLAQAGLQSYFTAAHTLTASSDSLNYTFPGGYARTVARKLRDSTSADRAVWVVYSTGVDTTRGLTLQGTGQRVVAQLARLTPGSVPTRAAMVASNGVQMTGTAGQGNPIDGHNFDTSVPGCTQVHGAGDTTGLVIPRAGYTGVGSALPVGKGVLGVDSLASASAVNDSTHVDWTKLVAGQFTPDFYNQLPAGPYPNSNYQTYYYPSGGVTIPSTSGQRGLLVVSGDVTLSSGAHWDGIIVAGGKLITPSGGYKIHGAIITGLNIALGQSVGASTVTRGSVPGTVDIQFDWCYTRSSMISLSYLVPINGTFVNAWKTY